ncbi:hypothetical protein EV424DRAFT_1344824 [Suillus variegatus]|nr:hypothetical protein EV424DRAFT_1344824 [Suillus variegatus]
MLHMKKTIMDKLDEVIVCGDRGLKPMVVVRQTPERIILINICGKAENEQVEKDENRLVLRRQDKKDTSSGSKIIVFQRIGSVVLRDSYKPNPIATGLLSS